MIMRCYCLHLIPCYWLTPTRCGYYTFIGYKQAVRLNFIWFDILQKNLIVSVMDEAKDVHIMAIAAAG